MIGKVDKYEILEELFIGRDTFVLKCSRDKIYAMKLLILNQTSKQMVDRFKREMKITATINHHNIIRGGDDCGLGKWRQKQCFYYLMEYVNGPSLRVLMEDGFKFSEIDVLFIALETLKGLTFLKNKNIIHRDIKPSNILIDQNCSVKIADLGLAKIVEHIDSHTQITMGPTILGTPYYLAPERTFNSDIDYIGDIYSLGATLYEMLTGFPPFRDFLGNSPSLSDYIDILDKYSSPTSVKKVNKSIPSNVAKIVDSMLHRDKKRRPSHEKLTNSISKVIQMFPRYPTDELLAKVQQIAKKNNEALAETKDDIKNVDLVDKASAGSPNREIVSQLENFDFFKDTIITLHRYRNVLYALRIKEKLSREEKIALSVVLREYTTSQRDMEIFRFLIAICSAFRQQKQQNIVKHVLTQKISFDLDFLEKVMNGFIRCVNLGPNHEAVKKMVFLHKEKQYTYIHVLNDMLKQNIVTKASIRVALMRLLVENELY
ncbi:serine/threonine protein kinase [Candidatus Uabimicrobium amorphum]|uniref:non-specific serine/threonine protein kinase n=1 Tax=Uabimicrobium amorphum TaxID=2596890 RepID=A0A5S9INT5_UABAM|nr:serine/threonine-protein kinase [Candidatus Uabimicrobium amorphum]BBM84836.1 serine/threonine protein kinase [Candidatus Uabimicrobium amorphum]